MPTKVVDHQKGVWVDGDLLNSRLGLEEKLVLICLKWLSVCPGDLPVSLEERLSRASSLPVDRCLGVIESLVSKKLICENAGELIIGNGGNGDDALGTVRRLVRGTVFDVIDDDTLDKFIREFGSSVVVDTLDVLIKTYSRSSKQVKSPGAVLRSSLSKGIVQGSPVKVTDVVVSAATSVNMDLFLELFEGSQFSVIGDEALGMFVEKYGVEKVFYTIDVLSFVYREREIRKPVSLLSVGLVRGVISPDGFVPFKQRKTKPAKKIKVVTDSGDPLFEEKILRFASLSSSERQKYINRVLSDYPVLQSPSFIEDLALGYFLSEN